MRKVLLAVAVFVSTLAAGCTAGPGCFERLTREGDVLIECR